jgi:hypothetical protein
MSNLTIDRAFKMSASLAVALALTGFARSSRADDTGYLPVNYNWGQILNWNSALCMGVDGGVAAWDAAQEDDDDSAGTVPIIQWGCESMADSPDQYWSVVWNGQIYQIVDYMNSGVACLAGAAGPEGTQLYVEACAPYNNYAPDQAWDFYTYTDDNNTVIESHYTGMVVAVDSASTSPGAAIIMWDWQTDGYSTHLEQIWQ